MGLFRTLNDEFESHSAQPLNSITYVPKHYDIRSFHGTDLSVPRTMPDFRYWNAAIFNGTSMITLSTPRSVVGRSIAAHTMAEIDLQNQALLDAQTIAAIELYTLASGDEGWPIDPNVAFGKDASLRYANTIAITLSSGILKTVTSTYRDNILTDFPSDGSTYYIELALPAFPAQAAGTHLDIANSFIDFTSDAGFAAGSTDSFRFNQSLVSLSAGGNVFFRINRDSLVNADLSNLQGVRFRLLSVGAMTFKAQSLRIYKSGDFVFPSTAIDTKRNTLRRSVPEASSAATEPSTGQGLILMSGTRPRNISEIIRFNSGHNPVGNDNYFAFYMRYDPITTNAIRVELNARSTQSTLNISEKTNGVSYASIYTTPTLTNILTAETDYFLKIETDGFKVRASIFLARGAFFGPLIYTTDWRTVGRDVRGQIGYDFNPYNYDFSIDYIKASSATFGNFQSSAYNSILPVQGASLYANNSPPEDLSQQNYISSGDADVTLDATFGNPAPASKFIRTGVSFFGGWETQDFTFIGDSHHLTITGKIFPPITLNRNFRVLLIDKYDTVAWIAYLPGLIANQWNEFTIPVNATIAPANYKFVLQEVGFYNDTFWVQDLKINHETVVWKISPNSGGDWYNFFNAVDQPYSGVNFDPVSYEQTVIDAKPNAYYSLGDSNTPAVDKINGANGVIGVGVITGLLGVITDSIDHAMSFPGTASITVGDAPQFSFTNNKFAFEFWMKAADVTTNIGILGKGAAAAYEYGIYSTTPGTLTFNSWDSTGAAVYPSLSWVYDTNWHHVVYRADGTRVSVFVDGVMVTSAAKSGGLNMSDTTSAFKFGTATTNAAAVVNMKGILDELVVYPNPLTDEVIWNHYQIGLAVKAPTAIKVRAETLSDTAWIEGFRLFPKYGLPGHLGPTATIFSPPSIIPGLSSTSLSIRTFGQLIAPPVTRSIRLTAFGIAAPIARDIRVTGQITSVSTQDIRIFGTNQSNLTQDIRLTGSSTTTITQDLRVTGTTVSTTTQALRITGDPGPTGSPIGLLMALTS